ncbi:hypothetical protein MSAN_01336100 [Mycena sanguinolenta]|uniref:Uncharacterized protein n=1 Tax=Mycena sanguinolenta TaxID=230812 RepID=A0A8H7D3A1_9AGAR|nr:hypothetical protein MSAN_01336100 [Mycena sanguinolenta]
MCAEEIPALRTLQSSGTSSLFSSFHSSRAFIYPLTHTRHTRCPGSTLVLYLDADAIPLMPASPSNPPWPERTAESSPPFAGQHASTSKMARQVIADQAAVDAAETQCQIFSGNEVISCFPTADTVVAQHEWATFVWNSNNPDFLQTERVDIYVFHGDSQEQVLVMSNQVNPSGRAGHVSQQVNDTWWGTRGANWDGTNISYPFYWLIARHGESLDDGTLIPQTTFSAVQTTFADSVLATRSSSSATSATSSASQTLVTSVANSSRSSSTTATTSVPVGDIQSNSSTPFPHWAIIVIVLGIVAVVAVCGLMLFGIFFLREREKRDRYPIRQTSPGPSEMVQADEAAPVAAAVAGGLARDTGGKSHDHDRNTSPDPRQFSESDAAIMANAFRAELRQPPRSFDDEEEDADADANDDVEEVTTAPERPDAVRERETLLRRGLASEGADIRSVDSVRGVRVESSNESHDHGRTSPRMSV